MVLVSGPRDLIVSQNLKKKKFFVPKCVMTPEDHFERHFFPEFRGEGGWAKESVEKIYTFHFFFFKFFHHDVMTSNC